MLSNHGRKTEKLACLAAWWDVQTLDPVLILLPATLLCRPGSAEILAIDPGAIETAGPPLARREHRTGTGDPARPRLGLLRRDDPLDPVAPRHGRDVGPHRPGIRRRRKGLAQIGGNAGLRLLRHRRDLQRDVVAHPDAGRLPHRLAHLEPMAALAIRFQRGPERTTRESTLHRDHAPRRQLRARAFGQQQEGPGGPLRARWPEQPGLKTDSVDASSHGGKITELRPSRVAVAWLPPCLHRSPD